MPAILKKGAVVCARNGEPRSVPVERQLNNGNGVGHYLNKRDPATRKRLFYSIEEWASLSESERLEAMDFSADAAVAPSPERLMSAYHNADVTERKALVKALLPELRAALVDEKPRSAK